MEQQQHEQQADAEPQVPSCLAGFFEGPVGDALALARQTPGLVLVVSLQEEGEAATAGVEASRRLDAETWSDPDVARRLSEATVALRLDWRSPDGVSFLAIYPAFQVPTIYLIAPLTGQPLGILLGFVTPQQFLAKLDECCAALSHPPSSSPAGPPASMTESATPPPPPSQELAPMDTTTTATSPREPEEGVQNANRAPAEAPATPQPLSSAEVAAQKERLLKRIEEVKRQKEAQEKQAERERELARRQNGKAALETMKTIEDINKRKELEQRRREQSEAERHKAQVREKIRRDREIRAQQQQQQQQAGPSPAAPSPSAATTATAATATTTVTTTSPSAATAAAAAATSAAIAFRMPDGSVEKADFAATSTLADCRKHLRTVVGVQGPFTLMTNFPRHVFADEEYALTLRDLQLCPSATLILTGATEYASSGGGAAAGEVVSTGGPGGGGTGLISSVTSYLWGFFSASPAAPPDRHQQQASAASATSASGRIPYSGGGGGGAGNVHGLRRDDMEGDEDNAYWNGNSTQQY